MTAEILPFVNFYFNFTFTLFKRLAILYLLILQIYNSYKVTGFESLKYLTNWGHLIVTTVFFLIALCNIFNIKAGHPLARLTSVVLHIAASATFLIFFFFWAVLSYGDMEWIFDLEERSLRVHYFFDSVIKHLMNPIIVWIFIMMNRTELKLSNIWYSFFFAGGYLAFNCAITILTGEPVYGVLDWKSTISHVYVVVALGLYFLGFYSALTISEGISSKQGVDRIGDTLEKSTKSMIHNAKKIK